MKILVTGVGYIGDVYIAAHTILSLVESCQRIPYKVISLRVGDLPNGYENDSC